jgi:hypothetical protein
MRNLAPSATHPAHIRNGKVQQTLQYPDRGSGEIGVFLIWDCRNDQIVWCRKAAAEKNEVVTGGKDRQDQQVSDSSGLRIRQGQAFLDGVFGELRHVVDFQFVHDVQAMDFNGFRADAKPLCGLLGGLAFREQLEHFPFPVG